jgi:hypothetical protein
MEGELMSARVGCLWLCGAGVVVEQLRRDAKGSSGNSLIARYAARTRE